MNPPEPRSTARRTPLVLAVLTLIAILAFAAVSRLVARLKANEKQIGWHAYEAGLTQAKAGYLDNAVDDFRAALSYDRDNPQYQLSLARALRDRGRLNEAGAYLLNLWDAAPQDSTINLALARLAARRQSIEDALRYYHNAIYGAWPTDPDNNRRETRFELIEFLLKQNAKPQAQAELMALAQVLPPDPGPHLMVADLLSQTQDYESALAQYKIALTLDHVNEPALIGAGDAAFHLGRYRSAEKYLQQAVARQPENARARAQLQTASMILESDPFLRHISDAERNRRITVAFMHAGERLRNCAHSQGIDLPNKLGGEGSAQKSSETDLESLWARWQAARPQLRRLSSPTNADLPDTVMDLVQEIEQQTSKRCGEPAGLDLALLLGARGREMADQ